jgi:hypothetical protein
LIVVGAGVEVEGVCAQPHRAPSPGEDGGADGVPDGEEGDHVDKKIVGESAKKIGWGHRVGQGFAQEKQSLKGVLRKSLVLSAEVDNN